MRSEEIPEEEPDEEPEPEPAPSQAAGATVVPSVGSPSREFEYRTEDVAVGDVATRLAELLTEASKEGWDFVQVVDAGDRRVILFRRGKRSERHAHPVGFFPPSKS